MASSASKDAQQDVKRGCIQVNSENLMKGPVDKEEKWKDLDINPLGTDDTSGDRKKTDSKSRDSKLKMKLRRGITVDSGSHHNVMPRRLVRKSKIRESKYSKQGLHYIAANKGKIPNEGETDFVFETKEGFLESWKFQIAEVNKALASIADRVDSNHRVVFDRDEKTGKDLSYIYNKTTNRAIKMTRVGNVWIIEAIVSGSDIDDTSFARRG